MRSSAARRRSWWRRRERRQIRPRPIIEDSDPRRRLALIAARFFGASAGDRRRRHRHQRQDVGRLVRAPALGRRKDFRGESRHGRRRQPDRHPDSQAHHAGSDRAASHPRRARRGRRHPSRARSVESRPAAAPRRRRHVSPPAPSPISRAIIWTITRASRIISSRSSACSPSCCRAAPPPWSMSTAKPGSAWRRSRRRGG